MSDDNLALDLDWLNNQESGAIAFIVLTTVFVALRLIGVGYVNWKRRHVKPMLCEDALVLASLISFLPLCACAIVNAKADIAFQYTDDREEMRELAKTVFKSSYGMSVAYPIACLLPKLSICCMYLTLFKVQTHMRGIVFGTMALLTANAIAWFVPTVMVCTPISGYWDPQPGVTKCLDYNIFGTWISLPNIVTDLFLMVLPLPYLWRMQLKLMKKIGLTLTFIAASIGVVAGSLRLAIYIHRTYIAQPGTEQSTKSLAVDFIVSYVEPGMYVIAACLPRLRSLVNELYSSYSELWAYLRARRRSYKSEASRLPSDSLQSPPV